MKKFIYSAIIIKLCQFNRVYAQCGFGIADGLCEAKYNTPECEYDFGDCCEHTCDTTDSTLSHQCGQDAPFNCTDPRSPNPTANPTPQPTYVSIVTTMLVDNYLSDAEGVAHTDISSNEFCFDHPYDFGFVSLGNWELTTDESLATVDQWQQYCQYNDSKKTCDSPNYIDPNGYFVLTFCCESNIWVIAQIDDGTDAIFGDGFWYYGRFAFFAIGNSIEDIEEWHSWEKGWLDDEYHTYSVSMFDHNCHKTGFIIGGVLLGIFFVLLIGVCIWFRPKSVTELLDKFETYSSKIEFVVQGILLGDSFIASIFITIDVGLTTVSSGIIVMTFCIISFLMFGVRFKISNSHILESENFGSLAGFVFDLCMGMFLVFMNKDYMGAAEVDEEGASNPFIFLILIGTWGGVIEEFLQLLSKFKSKRLHCLINWYLLKSGHIIAIINMFLLSFITLMYFTEDGDLVYEAAAIILVVALVMFGCSIYSCYAYVGCCGKWGGHKKPNESEENENENEKKGDEDVVVETETPSDGKTVTVDAINETGN